MHAQGLQIGANFHDDDGVVNDENPLLFNQFVQAMGFVAQDVLPRVFYFYDECC